MKVWVRPKRGLVVHDHNIGDQFPQEGREVDRDMIVERRISEGALIVMEAPAEPADPPAKHPATVPESKGAAKAR